jgi:serine phosphatase RsbU (regulator of sigma subunit)/anti-sigma regulatory factor (Ser/Thr protein kinase)
MINSFKLVIDEAATNIIRHGYRDVKNGEIEIKAIIRRLSLTIVIIDQGTSYDPRQANTPDLAKYVDIGKKGGLGILMMRKLMDDIQYLVTEKGNEFRLTKFREATDEPKILQVWHSLNMKTRYSLISSFVFTLVIAGIFTMLFLDLKKDVNEEIFNIAATSTRSLAKNLVSNFEQGKLSIEPYENIESIVNSTEFDIYFSFITNNQNKIIAGIPTGIIPLERNYTLPENSKILDSLENVAIYSYPLYDTLSIFDVVAEVRSPSGVVYGSAHIWINETTIDEITSSRQLVLIIVLIFVLGFGNAGAFYLVAQILKSFHSLAEWVRQVVHGKVDQDEIDIDTSDEIGEIAHAFNEMTDKFRKAQVNLMEQQKLQKELQVAQEIQQMLLPSDFPKVDGFDIGSYYEAAKEVGGDLFDFVEIDEEAVGIVVADVSGKGVPGSLIMTMIRTAIRLESRGNKNPAEVLAKVNNFVSEDMRKGMFVTMFYCILDSRNRVIYYASAGHNPMILFRSSSKQTYYLNPSGFPVGIRLPDPKLFEQKIQTGSIRLREDDILILYTDGVTEAMNYKRELYRDERFLQSIRDNGHLDVSEFVKSVKNDLKHFTGGAPQNDDITFVAIKEKLMVGEVIYKTHKKIIDLIKNGMRVKDACDKLNISSYQYYKYKGIVDEGGLEALKNFLDGDDHIEKQHISIEQKAKIFDIIKENPKYGAKRIALELNAKKYSYEKLDERRIYNELVKLRLNTQERRERFLEKGQNKRLKQPGTPLLTLDGKVILDFETSEGEIARRTSAEREAGSSYTPDLPAEEKKSFIREIRSSSTKEEPVKTEEKTVLTEEKTESVKKEEEVKQKVPEIKKAPVKEKPKTVVKEKAKKAVKKEPAPGKVKAKKEKEEFYKSETDVIEISEKNTKAEALKQEVIEIEEITVPTTRELTNKAVEKIDNEFVDKLFHECRDDFQSINQLKDQFIANPEKGDELRKMNLILKIVMSNPILKSLPEIKQLINQSQSIIDYIHKNYNAFDRNTSVKAIEMVVSYLAKDNISNKSESIIEKINRIGILHKNFEKYSEKGNSPDDELSKIRNKIVNKRLVKNTSLLEVLDDNSKK